MASIFYALDYTDEMMAVYIVLLFILLFIVLKTDIIFDRKKLKDIKEKHKKR